MAPKKRFNKYYNIFISITLTLSSAAVLFSLNKVRELKQSLDQVVSQTPIPQATNFSVENTKTSSESASLAQIQDQLSEIRAMLSLEGLTLGVTRGDLPDNPILGPKVTLLDISKPAGVYMRATSASPKVGVINSLDEYTVTLKTNEWYQISFETSATSSGWVKTSEFKETL